MLEEKLEELREQKMEATISRNLDEFDEALDTLKTVTKGLAQLRNDKGVDRGLAVRIRAELADTWGMMGGVHRRRNEPEKALEAYRNGREIEEIDGKSTYNLTNTITLRITLEKELPTESVMHKDLQIAIKNLERETKGPRDDEWWAWSDLGQFYLLLDNPDEARRCYKHAHNTGPSKGEYRRHIAILEELAAATKERAPSVANNIKTIVAELAQRIK